MPEHDGQATPEAAASGGSGPVVTQPCPACGVAVAPGYVRCPRCQADLPGARRQRATAAPPATGTALPEPPPRPWVWPAVGILVAVAITGLVWLVATVLTRTPSRATTPSAIAPGAAAATGATGAAGAADDEAPAAAPGAADEAEVDDEAARRAALRTLDEALRGERLWSSVATDGDTVVVGSESCGDVALVGIVGGAAAELRAAGLRAVRCEAPHGEVVFERAL